MCVFIARLAVLLSRKLLKIFRYISGNCIVVSLYLRPWCQTLSNAFEMSRVTTVVILFVVRALLSVSVSVAIAVFVDLFGLKPC